MNAESDRGRHDAKPRIAVFSGPTATIQKIPPLVTSNKAREKYGLEPLRNRDGSVLGFDALRAQRLARPVTVYIEQLSAHPLERDVPELYAAPDGYIGQDGEFSEERRSREDIAVYEAELDPSDGLYLLPYMARKADGSPWDGDASNEFSGTRSIRQTFYPDACRLFEEIDRFGISRRTGLPNLLADRADFDFFRAAPSGGYTKGLKEAERCDVGEGDIPEEVVGRDFFFYEPARLRREPHRGTLVALTNIVLSRLASRQYSGALWLEGSATIEETLYWLALVSGTTVPIAGVAAQRPHGAIGNDGDRNIVSAVEYILSNVWMDPEGRDSVGPVLVVDERLYSARDIQKGDARPGGYVTTGGLGGIVGAVGDLSSPVINYRPMKNHTYMSSVRTGVLPRHVTGRQQVGESIEPIEVGVVDEQSALLQDCMPTVNIVKYASYSGDGSDELESETDIVARINQNLREAPLAGFVIEGVTPFATMNRPVQSALRRATYSGMPVVRVGRGNAEGIVPRIDEDEFILGNNLTATKARLLLMASLLKLGSLPVVKNSEGPTREERDAMRASLAAYQAIFDSH